jgi:RNA 3'-terminal phosphate cyclase (ATP)
MGPKVEARLIRHGFYPRGGGRIEVEITPAPLTPIDCIERGALRNVSATALFAGLPFDIADREIETARKLLNWPHEAFAVRQLPDGSGPGNALLLKADYGQVTEIVTGFGQLGVPARALAKTAANRMAGYQASQAFAGPYLQDQLVLPFVLARGGTFTTVKPGGHLLTACEGAERFTGIRPALVQRGDGIHEFRIG